MSNRLGRFLILPMIVCFWLAMNILLFKNELGVGKEGNIVPAETVWTKILTAPDNSLLEIFQDKRKIGYCRWSPNVGQELATGKVMSEMEDEQGRVRHPRFYTLEIEGNAGMNGSDRLRFDTRLTFSTNRVWQEFDIKTSLRPMSYQLSGSSKDQSIQLKVLQETNVVLQHKATFQELRDPNGLMASLGEAGAGVGLLTQMIPHLPAGTNKVDGLDFGVRWEGRLLLAHLGRSPVQVYRLQTILLQKYPFSIFISKVGEVLRIELPNNLVLRNDAMPELQIPKI